MPEIHPRCQIFAGLALLGLVAMAPSQELPRSEHTGGTLKSHVGEQEIALPLRHFAVDVVVDDGFAHTTMDWTFFNHTQLVHQATFHFPLPRDASLTHVAFSEEGKLHEGVLREMAREHTVPRQTGNTRTPEVREWQELSTLRCLTNMQLPRQEYRMRVRYTQRLATLHGQSTYRLTGAPAEIPNWSLRVRIKNGAGIAWRCDSLILEERQDQGDLLLNASGKSAAFPAVGLRLTGSRGTHFRTAEHGGARYLLMRYRPELPEPGEPHRRDWVVLMETSADRDPMLLQTQKEIVRSILQNASPEDTLSLLSASRRTTVLTPRPVPNQPQAVEAALATVQPGMVLGALDLGNALDVARPLLKAARSPVLLHLGTGLPVLGEARPEELGKRLPAGVRYVGIGVGQRWQESVMRHLAEATDGYVTRIQPNDLIGWRALETMATLNASRLQGVEVRDAASGLAFHTLSRQVGWGEELVAVCRVGQGKLPSRLRIQGRCDGKEFVRDVDVTGVLANGSHVPRVWAQAEIQRLLAADDIKNRSQIVKLSLEHRIQTPFTALAADRNLSYIPLDNRRGPHVREVPSALGPPGNQWTLPASRNMIDRVGPVRSLLQDASQPAKRRILTQFTDSTHPIAVPDVIPKLREADFSRNLSGPLATIGYSGLGIDADGMRDVREDLELEPGLPGLMQRGLNNLPRRLVSPPAISSPAFWMPGSVPAIAFPYHRPSWTKDPRGLSELLSLTPNLTTTATDLRAWVEANEFQMPPARIGQVDPRAKALLDKARQPRWRSLDLPALPMEPGRRVLFDGAGKYVWERTLPSGLREQGVCDGTDLWCLCRELGVATKRVVARSHRLEFADLVPWAVPSADDLARDADVQLVAPDTVVVKPHASRAKPTLSLRFGKDGDLIERRMSDADGKTISQQALSSNGTMELRDSDGALVERVLGNLAVAKAPTLRPELTGLVVIQLPETSQTPVFSQRNSNDPLRVFAWLHAEIAKHLTQHGFSEAKWIEAESNLASRHPDLADQIRRWHAPEPVGKETTLDLLARGWRLCVRWNNSASYRNPAVWDLELPPALAYAQRHKNTDLAWALLGLVQDRLLERTRGDLARDWSKLAEAYAHFTRDSWLEVPARYEHARCLFHAGQNKAASKQFRALADDLFAKGRLLFPDGDFRHALGEEGWSDFVKQRAAQMVKRGKWDGVFALAKLCRELEDDTLSDRLITDALARSPSMEAVPDVLNWLPANNPLTARLMGRLLADPKHSRNPTLWLQAANLASRHGQSARRLQCLEKASELGGTNPVEVSDTENVHLRLIREFDALVSAHKQLGVALPADLKSKVVRAAAHRVDTWANTVMWAETGALLRRLGDVELALDFETSSLAIDPGNMAMWLAKATTWEKYGDRQRAAAARERVLTCRGRSASDLYSLATQFHYAGRRDLANQLFRMILAREWPAADNPILDSVRQWLGQGPRNLDE